MKASRSLTLRLVANWSLLSLLVFFTLPVTVIAPLASVGYDDTGYGKLESLTVRRARDLLQRALRQAPDGVRYIEATPELRRYVERNPNFLYAAIDPATGAPFAGSSKRLADYFAGRQSPIEILGQSFLIANDRNLNARGATRMVRTPFGRFSVVVYGASFQWDDLLYLLYYFPTLLNVATYLLLFVAMAFGAWIVVRKSLQPLRRSAATVSQISLDTLEGRLPVDDVPSEIAPFIEAVNAAFQRVKEGVARQRRFIANSAHELRTPIAILRARLDGLDDTPVKRELKRDAQRVQTILEQLLVLAQLEERGRVAETPVADIGEIVLATTADFAPLALGAGRRIIFEPSPTRVSVRAYPWAVECVVTNLLDNALRVEPAGGGVVVRVTPDGGVDVADHGEGVDVACREQIFEPFWRKNDATPGTGLGLAIARELMEKQGGRIWVDETPGGGATFKLRFSGLAAAPSPPPRKAIDIAGAPV